MCCSTHTPCGFSNLFKFYQFFKNTVTLLCFEFRFLGLIEKPKVQVRSSEKKTSISVAAYYIIFQIIVCALRTVKDMVVFSGQSLLFFQRGFAVHSVYEDTRILVKRFLISSMQPNMRHRFLLSSFHP